MEYQAKELFAKHGVAVTLGKVVDDPPRTRGPPPRSSAASSSSRRRSRPAAAARPAASRSPRRRTRPRSTPARSSACEIKGLPVNRVLVAPARRIEEEYYFSFLLDRANRPYLCIASVEGGVEIEEVAKTNPDAVKKIPIDPGAGVDAAKAARDRRRGRLPGRAARPGGRRWSSSCGRSSSRRTPRWSRSTRSPGSTGDKLEALDGKVSLDDNADFRHEDHAAFEIREEADPLEAKAKDKGLNYVKLDGAGRASSATARAWSCRPSTSSRTPVSSTAA